MSRRRPYKLPVPRRLPKTRRGLMNMLLGLTVVVIASLVAPLLLGGDATPTAEQTPVVRAVEVALIRRPDGYYVDDPGRLPLVTVDRIVDGDTLDVTVGGATQRIRVFGLAAPERDEPCGTEATEQLRLLAGAQVRLLADERLQDQYDRELRYLFTPEGRSLDAALIADGAARAWRDDGAYRDILVGIEMEAREGRRGCLWGN